MAKSPRFIFTGDKEIDAKLKEFATRAQRRIVRKAAEAGLQPVLAAAKQLIPVATGKLRNNLSIGQIKRSRKRIGFRLSLSGGEQDFKGETFYGAFQEYGWRVGKRSASQLRAQSLISKRKKSRGRRAADIRRGRKKVAGLLEAALKLVRGDSDKRRKIPGKEFMKTAMQTQRAAAHAEFRRVAAIEIENEARKLR